MKSLKFLAALAVLIILPLAVCSGGKTAAPLVRIITEKEGEGEGFFLIYENGKKEKTESFSPDDELFIGGAGNFSSDIKGGRIVNTVKNTELKDENGNPAKADETIKKLMSAAAAEIRHQIYSFKIFKSENEYLAFFKLNVNWQDPGILYRFDAESGKLEKIYEADGVDVSGIAPVR